MICCGDARPTRLCGRHCRSLHHRFPLPPTPAFAYDAPSASLPPGPTHPQALSICISLCESGVNPEALASVVTELRRERAVVEGSRATAPV